MSNFNFLKPEWPAIHTEAAEAESLAFISPKACAVICRSALEKSVRWLYANDSDLHLPYDTNLSSLIHEQCFKDNLKPSMFREINLIRKFGNSAAHGDSIRNEESIVAVKNLFRFLSFVAIYYSENEPEIPSFNELLLPKGNEVQVKKEELKALEKKLDKRTCEIEEDRKKIQEQAKKISELQGKIESQKELVKQRKESRNQKIEFEKAIPELVPEWQTRKLYIDQMLKEAGWYNLRAGYELEYEVEGMPLSTNKTGIGYADYVLWGDDGKPLAVIEAKKTKHDARKGQHQASLYADCLEKMHGQRPVIFFSNGFETYIWDDTFYQAREVFGFYAKDELQLLVDRRESRKDIRNFTVNNKIINRDYQFEAIKRVAESLVKNDKEGNLKAGARRSLLVMATGSGKTRTSAAIVDMLTKSNWAKRILFLADRNALVTQAKNAFSEHLPHLSTIDLTKEKEDPGTRIVFSTYPTIMNRIDGVKTHDERFYGVGHFDLIIIDEAHRSVYQKYGAIFEYFDALLIGLTATPKTEIDRNTYSLFEIEDSVPTYAYELNEAVKNKYLVPPKAMSVPLSFMREGIRYHELSERDKQEYEKKFGDPTNGEAPDEISSTALNTWLFNTDTVDKVLAHLMSDGIKVEGGDKLGKTIIFAKNHLHAQFIEERFNKNYPEYAGHFLSVIDNYEDKAQSLLEKFVDPAKDNDPQIAVSVDMMDTGVDAPRVVNLVFFKLVRSYSKFWQMIGRGTRLCPNLFGPHMDKQHFVIFDYCQNFEFFEENPNGIDGSSQKSITQRTFELTLDIVYAIRNKVDGTEVEQEIADLYQERLLKQVQNLDRDRFMVNMNLRYVVKYSDPKSWQSLSSIDIIEIKDNISKLILPETDDHELARRFDIIMLNLSLALIVSVNPARYISKVADIAVQLCRVNVPDVKRNKELLMNLQKDVYWQTVDVKNSEEIRKTVRELMKFLESSPQENVYTNMEDDINIDEIREKPLLEYSTRLQSYRDRVESYIRKNKHHIVIQKLRTNKPITFGELQLLEDMLFDGSDRGTKEEFEQEYGEQPLGKFIRSIVGLDVNAANEAFSEFLQNGNFSADQMTFIKNIISFLEVNGTIDKEMLFQAPFTDMNDQGLIGLFDDADSYRVIHIVDRINKNAEVA